ncbi:MAG TPA: T9SS type A sorting domain-containing protein [Ignavibacteria bacterium]
MDSNTIYGNGRRYNGDEVIYRTFNKGLTWDSVAISGPNVYLGISFLNKDTGFVSGFDGNNFHIWKTINGGVTLVSITNSIGDGTIFFLKYKINGEYYGWCCHGGNMYKTTNSGNNWFQVGGAGSLWQLEFINENTGFATTGGVDMQKTTNGGLNWISYVMPTGNGIVVNDIKNFKVINSNIIYGDYGTRQLPNNSLRGIIWKSTNGGVNWGYQQPDTASPYMVYSGIEFSDSLNGWSYNIHTTNGGGPIIYTDISNNSITLPNTFVLKQNYPNPFNPTTTIEFSIPKDSYVKLKIFDITGKTVFYVINDFLLYAGNHKYTIDAFNTLGLSSGVYFYRLEATQRNKNNNVFTETKKMLHIK